MNQAKKDFLKYKKAEEKQEQVVLDLQEKLNAAQLKLNQIKADKRDKGLQYYTLERRKDIVTRAQRCGFSAEDIEKMTYYLDDAHWNQDEVDKDGGILETYQSAEEFLEKNEHSPSVFENFFSALGTIPSEDERGEQNDN